MAPNVSSTNTGMMPRETATITPVADVPTSHALNDHALEASLLGLPAELRVRIYRAAYEVDELCVRLYGRADGARYIAKRVDGALALPRVCRLVHQEIMPMRPRMGDMDFRLKDLTMSDARHWTNYLGDDNLSKIQRLRIHVYGNCGRPGHGHSGYCDPHSEPCGDNSYGTDCMDVMDCKDYCVRSDLEKAKEVWGLHRHSIAIDRRKVEEAKLRLLDHNSTLEA